MNGLTIPRFLLQVGERVTLEVDTSSAHGAASGPTLRMTLAVDGWEQAISLSARELQDSELNPIEHMLDRLRLAIAETRSTRLRSVWGPPAVDGPR